MSVFTDPTPHNMTIAYSKTSTPLQAIPSYSRWKHREINLSKTFNDPNFTSENQKLVGDVNPRTKIAPIISAPIFANEFWRPTDFVVPSGINDQKTRELFQSGYATDLDNCSSLKQHPVLCNTAPVTFECKQGGCVKVQNNQGFADSEQCNAQCKNQIRENYDSCNGNYYEQDNYVRDHNTIAHVQSPNGSERLVNLPPQNGDMITPMGYNANQLELHNIPSNLAVGDCVKNNVFNKYNKQLYTSLIQPGVYTRNEIIEPVQSNMGISFTQQFEPTTCSTDAEGNTEFVYHDPRLINKEPIVENEFVEEPNRSNVYDPRFTGYGTGYRSYIEPVTGQARFYYDDIDAIKKYNYISRNKLDFTDFGQTSGAMRHKEFDDVCEIRKKAQLLFADETIKQRTELQERLMRKMNTNAWQQKSHPIHTRQMKFNISSRTNAARQIAFIPPP